MASEGNKTLNWFYTDVTSGPPKEKAPKVTDYEPVPGTQSRPETPRSRDGAAGSNLVKAGLGDRIIVFQTLINLAAIWANLLISPHLWSSLSKEETMEIHQLLISLGVFQRLTRYSL